MRRPWIQQSRWFVWGVVLCGVLALIATAAIVFAVVQFVQLITP